MVIKIGSGCPFYCKYIPATPVVDADVTDTVFEHEIGKAILEVTVTNPEMSVER
jgi:hypothetical protein